jgi:hypothetical protein
MYVCAPLHSCPPLKVTLGIARSVSASRVPPVKSRILYRKVLGLCTVYYQPRVR